MCFSKLWIYPSSHYFNRGSYNYLYYVLPKFQHWHCEIVILFHYILFNRENVELGGGQAIVFTNDPNIVRNERDRVGQYQNSYIMLYCMSSNFKWLYENFICSFERISRRWGWLKLIRCSRIVIIIIIYLIQLSVVEPISYKSMRHPHIRVHPYMHTYK
jgi:hypothetical protein